MKTSYTVQTRNWNSDKAAHSEFMDLCENFGVERFENASGDLDDKYYFETTSKKAAEIMEAIFVRLQDLSGGAIYTDKIDSKV